MNKSNLSMSFNEILATSNKQEAAMQASIAGCIYLAAALEAELAEINYLAENGQQTLSDERLAQFNIQLSFKNSKVDIPMSMDTYDYLLTFLQQAANDADIYR
jgi:hypothetical protein